MSTEMFPLPCNKVSVTDIRHIYNGDGKLGEGGQGVVHKLVYNSDKCKKAVGIPDQYCQCIYDNYNIIARKRDFSGTVNDEEISLLQKVIDIPNVNRYILHDYEHIYMEACSGGDLFDAIVGMGPFKEDKVAQIMFTLFHTVYHLHKEGIVHRDIKADNILLQFPIDVDSLWPQHLQVIDFGLALELSNDTYITDRKIIGTPQFMAPEVVERKYNNKCDIWSLCALMLTLFTRTSFFNYNTNDDGVLVETLWGIGGTASNSYTKFKASNKVFPRKDGLEQVRVVIRENMLAEDRESLGVLSDNAIEFILSIVGNQEGERPTAQEALCHPWLQEAAVVRSTSLKQQIRTATGEKKTSLRKELEDVETILRMNSSRVISTGGAFATLYSQKYKKYKAKYKALHTRR